MRYKTNYVCPECELDQLYLELDKLPKELATGALSGLNITKDMLRDALEGGEGHISEETLNKSRLGDKHNSLYCISCDTHYSFGKIVNYHMG